MIFRIGINLGDVMLEGDDVYGDGVNIAARLQELAEPGGILISGPVYEQVHNKLSVGFDCLGEQRLKNVANPVTGLTAMPCFRFWMAGRTSYSGGDWSDLSPCIVPSARVYSPTNPGCRSPVF
jgi:hypothetical protein